ncbi:MAG: DUF2892 domain-containing protein [Candidatus Micrarchaeia archaeon]|jgi:hypothetical protein
MKLFEKNVGGTDKAIRIVAGVVLIVAVFMNYFAAPLSYLFAAIGVILFATGILGTCGLYSLLGMNTAGKKK